MRTLLLFALALMVALAPGAAADDPPVCGNGLKACVLDLIEDDEGCNILYDYVQECSPPDS